MKKYLKIFLLALVVIATTSSCSTEYRTLSRMNKLTNRVEKYGEYYTADDWRDALDTYKQIAQDTKQCNFTPKEREQMGEMEGRCIASFTRWAGDKVAGIFTHGKGLIKGFLDGLGFSDDKKR